jgi:hypothetical protein
MRVMVSMKRFYKELEPVSWDRTSPIQANNTIIVLIVIKTIYKYYRDRVVIIRNFVPIVIGNTILDANRCVIINYSSCAN